MARTPTGNHVLPEALKAAADASTAEELRVALAVALPLQHGLSLKETAAVLGRSVGWVALHRKSFINGERRASSGNDRHGGRRNQLLPPDEEAEFLEAVCTSYIEMHRNWRRGVTRGPERYAEIELLFVDHVQKALADRVHRAVSLASAYNLMARVGRQRFAQYEAWFWRRYCQMKI
jgi:hypothetical protein